MSVPETRIYGLCACGDFATTNWAEPDIDLWRLPGDTDESYEARMRRWAKSIRYVCPACFDDLEERRRREYLARKEHVPA